MNSHLWCSLLCCRLVAFLLVSVDNIRRVLNRGEPSFSLTLDGIQISIYNFRHLLIGRLFLSFADLLLCTFQVSFLLHYPHTSGQFGKRHFHCEIILDPAGWAGIMDSRNIPEYFCSGMSINNYCWKWSQSQQIKGTNQNKMSASSQFVLSEFTGFCARFIDAHW